MMHTQHSDWLFNTESRVLQADWLILENNEKAALNISTLYNLKITTYQQAAISPLSVTVGAVLLFIGATLILD